MANIVRHLPKPQHRNIVTRKRVSLIHQFRVFNRFGELLTMEEDSIRGFVHPLNGCICPPILEATIERDPSDCNLFMFILTARETEKLGCGSFYYTIDQNWRDPLKTLERPMTGDEIDQFSCGDLTIRQMENFAELEPTVPALPTFRLQEGRLEVRI